MSETESAEEDPLAEQVIAAAQRLQAVCDREGILPTAVTGAAMLALGIPLLRASGFDREELLSATADIFDEAVEVLDTVGPP